jgi:hypothetical protein
VQRVTDGWAVAGDRQVLDLETGGAVMLKVASAGRWSEQTRRTIRCDGPQKLRHRCLATLLDCGGAGNGDCFEAWPCGPQWTGARAVPDDALGIAAWFFSRCGLTIGREPSRAGAVRLSQRGAVV